MRRRTGRPWIALALSGLSLSCPRVEAPIPATAPAAPVATNSSPSAPVASASGSSVAPPPSAATLASASPAAVELPSEPADLPLAPDEADSDPDLKAKQDDDQQPMIGALAKETWIYAKPSWKSGKIGYLRAGAVVQRAADPAGYAGCEKGWYRVVPRGYVCVGAHASTDTSNPVFEAAHRRPDRTKGLPYVYAMSRFPPPPLYVRLPSEKEQQMVETGLKAVKRNKRSDEGLESILGPVPGSLLYERVLPSLKGPQHSRETLYTSRPVARSGFALVDAFEWTDRLFGITTDMNVIPLDRTRIIKPSAFKGIELTGDTPLPAGFMRSRAARRYRIEPGTPGVRDDGPLTYRQGVQLTGKQVRAGGDLFHETTDGSFVREKDGLILIPPVRTMPGWAQKGKKWIDISILRQTLVAFEGTRPVFATLVSTGADGLGDPKKTHSTVQGVFVVHTKHVAITMDGDEVGDEFDLRDVPYVQYFNEGYALHAAYWHDEFGSPRSHGCINLSPQDAAWLFAWTDPSVPEGWHGYLQPRGGAIVYTHP